MTQAKPYKIPESVLVVIHSADHHVLLIERTDQPGFWQSVTGSLECDERPIDAAWRELKEETGWGPDDGDMIETGCSVYYAIFERWLHRYPANTTHNKEYLFYFAMKEIIHPTLSPNEHITAMWCPPPMALPLLFSPSNVAAISHIMADSMENAYQTSHPIRYETDQSTPSISRTLASHSQSSHS